MVLAAGASTRMGEPKQLLDIGGVSLLDHVLDRALRSQLDQVVLVLGSNFKEIRKKLKVDFQDSRLLVVENSNYLDGISSSIIAGLQTIEDRFDNCMIILGDMPNISTGLIDRLLNFYFESGKVLGAVKKSNKRSLPVIFNRQLFPELHQLTGDKGATDLFRKYSSQVCMVEPVEEYDDMDIDTPEDFEKYRKVKGVKGSSPWDRDSGP